MKSKLIVLALMFASAFVILPASSYAAASEKSSTVTVNEFAPQIRVRIGQKRRGKNWNRGRHRGMNNNRRTRTVRQVYYVNGRRYVRYVRVRG